MTSEASRTVDDLCVQRAAAATTTTSTSASLALVGSGASQLVRPEIDMRSKEMKERGTRICQYGHSHPFLLSDPSPSLSLSSLCVNVRVSDSLLDWHLQLSCIGLLPHLPLLPAAAVRQDIDSRLHLTHDADMSEAKVRTEGDGVRG